MNTKAKLVEQVGKFAGDGLRLLISRPSHKKSEKSALEEYPEQTEALQRLGPHTVVTLHENGDAMVKTNNKLYVVTTSGRVFTPEIPDSSSTPQFVPYREATEQEETKPLGGSGLPNMAHQKFPKTSKKSLPTRDETTRELKRRLARELYRAELDLAAGLRIAGKPCDCLENKHSLEIDAAAEEMVSQDPGNPVYLEIRQWFNDNLHKVTVDAIESGRFKKEYPGMASRFKDFRKRVMGTAAPTDTDKPGTSFTIEDAKKMAAEAAAAEVEKAWTSAEKK